MKYLRTIFLAVSALLLSTAAASAQIDEFIDAPEGEWIALSGTIFSMDDDSFQINYGYGNVTIEMDGFGWYDENVLRVGDFVIVRGHTDVGFFGGRTLLANSIYVDRLSEYIYADESENNAFYSLSISDYAGNDNWIGLSGKVLESNLEDQQFVLDSGFEAISIDTSKLQSTPFLETGDRVMVYGELDNANFWESREISATSVTKLSHS